MDKDKLKQSLADADCPADAIKRIMDSYDCGNAKGVLGLMKKERCRVMQEYHECGRKVDCMDFLLRQVEKELR